MNDKQDTAEWQKVDKLADEQKFEAAAKAAEEILARHTGKNERQWTRALVKVVQLRVALHGYETSVRFLKDQPWPKEPLNRLTLDVFYAHTLMTYLQAYGWEIGQRERVDTKGAVDLKAWTSDQIYTEALKTYDEAWKNRAALKDLTLDALGDYITPNNYPREIRGTVRDVLSYFIVEQLANSAYWRPEESNEIYRLDLGSLLGKSHKADSVATPDRHPLERLVTVLDDLEIWHSQSGREEAALEARLERLRRLHQAFTDTGRRETVRTAAAKSLDGQKDRSWWSWGMATLAGMHRELGDLIKAHALATEGAKAHPKSLGAQACRAIIGELEAPSYQLTSMSHDAANRRSVMVEHANLKKLHFRAWHLDVEQHLAGTKDYDLLPDRATYRRLAAKKPGAAWSVELKDPADYQRHHTYLKPPLTQPGLWFIAASARADFKDAANHLEGVNLIVGDLTLVSRQPGDGTLEVQVLDGDDGKPVGGVAVKLYARDWGKTPKVRTTGKTDASGLARLKGASGDYSSMFVVAAKGEQVAVDTDNFYLGRSHQENKLKSTMIYTDRAIYRPGQTLHWKALAWGGTRTKADYQPATGESVTISLRDANHQEVAKTTVKTNEYGTASGTFDLPQGRLLGAWRLTSSFGNSASMIRVEEYKRPTFEVSLKDPKGALRLNQKAELSGEAKYYFGLPVTGGSIKWRVERTPVYAWWWHYWHRSFAIFQASSSRPQIIASGVSPVREDGGFDIAFVPEAEALTGDAAKGVSYSYKVSADLTDEGGETRSATRSFRVGYVSVEAAIAVPGGFVRGAAGSEVTVSRTTLDGVGRAGKGTWTLYALKGPDKTLPPADLPRADRGGGDQTPWFREIEGDLLRPRWQPDYEVEQELARWADGKETAKGELTHDDKGKAALKLPLLVAGAYRLRYRTKDEAGADFDTWRDFVVAGKKAQLPLPFFFEVESSSVDVGGVVRMFIHTGLPGQTLTLIQYRDHKVVSRRVLTAADNGLHEIPVTDKDRGGFSLELSAMMDHQFISGTQTIVVPWDNKELDVSFESLRDKMRPGTKETFRVVVKGRQSALAAAEVLALMYDKSLDYFARLALPSPAGIWPSYTGAIHVRTNLEPWDSPALGEDGFPETADGPDLHGDSPAFESGYGVGGMGRHGRGGGFALSESADEMVAAPAAAAPMPAGRIRAKAAPREEAEMDSEGADDAPSEKKKELARNGAAPNKQAETQQAGDAPEPIRQNFAETAVFAPNLITGKDGSTAVEFTVPDSVTSWNVWALALTRDLRGGVAHKETKSVKNLMVRPYLPRFFREGDTADLAVTVNNAGDKELSGTLSLAIESVDAQPAGRKDGKAGDSALSAFGVKDATAPFTVKPGVSVTLKFPLKAPHAVGTYAFKVTAKAGAESDGELRPLPVLPGRLHLVQSRFAALRDQSTKTLKFADMLKNDDKSLIHDRMVVTVDAQLFYGVLKSLPYLVRYPYECTEQTLNRFLSTGIVASVFKDFPQVAKMAKAFAGRKTQVEAWDTSDPNRTMTMEESPWVFESKGGASTDDVDMINTLNESQVKSTRDSALAKLKKAQAADGGFPWFPGGRPSPYITLYIMHGLAKAAEFGIAIPKDMVRQGWMFLARHFREEYASRMIKDDCCWEFLTFLNYVASSYPDDSWTGEALKKEERQRILDFTFGKWKQHSPYLKGLLALTLKRAGRAKDATLVFDSVMDSAKTDDELGTYWAAEDRSWLWYNDTIESHAYALRTLMELDPKDRRSDGMVQWLFLNKKMNHWKSTRATAEVIYSLVHYLRATNALGVREAADLTVGGETRQIVFDPDSYKGREQIVVEGKAIDPGRHGVTTIAKSTKGVMFASATWHFSTEKLPEAASGDFFSVTRRYFRRETAGKETTLAPLEDGDALRVGDEVEVQLSLRTKHAAEYVHLRDPRGAGFEPVSTVSRWKWDLGISWYEEIRDSGGNFFFEWLPVGEYTFKYRVRATMAGAFRVGPAQVQSMYAPEFAAYSAGNRLEVAPAK